MPALGFQLEKYEALRRNSAHTAPHGERNTCYCDACDSQQDIRIGRGRRS